MHCVLYNRSTYSPTPSDRSEPLLPLLPSPTRLTFSSQLSDLLTPLLSPGSENSNGEVLLPIDCGPNQGILYLSRLCQGSKGPCILFNGYFLTPNEFQYVSGRETAKDWKRSIRHNGKSIKLLISKGVLSVHSPICECSAAGVNSLASPGSTLLAPAPLFHQQKRMELLHSNSSSKHTLTSYHDHHHPQMNANNNPMMRKSTGITTETTTRSRSVKRESRLTSIIDHLLISRSSTNEVEYRSCSSSESESWGECSSSLGNSGEGSASAADSPPPLMLTAAAASAVSTTSAASPPAILPPPPPQPTASAESGEEEASSTLGMSDPLATAQRTTPPHSGQNPPSSKSKTSKKARASLIKNERQSPESVRSSPSPPKPGSGGSSPPLKQMEHMMSRNYSDFMRSLAAKYNHNNPNDLYSSARSNSSFTFDTRFLKPGAAAAAASLLAFQQQQQQAAEKLQFPLIDMSSTQTLLSMVRSAAANSGNSGSTPSSISAQQLLSSLPTPQPQGLKRPSSPLDLSSAAPALGIGQSKKSKRSTSSKTGCGSSCSGCSNEAEAIAEWGVEDVCRFVATIDICAEYVQAFRDHSIDGSSLPLLTEDHLIQNMGLKLGPALKFKSTVAKKLGNCPICIHCLHCHSSTTSPAAELK